MELKDIEAALELMKQYELGELEWKRGEDSIRLTNHSAGALAINPSSPVPGVNLDSRPHENVQSTDRSHEEMDSDVVEIRSPFVGTFYQAPSPDAEPFVKVGGRINTGDTLCIVEAMKLMNEIEAERGGVITKILVENEQPVEFNQVLFLLKV